MDFNFNVDNDIALEAETAGGSFGVLDTGPYQFTINHASISKSKNGNNMLDINLTTEAGHSTTLYGMCIDPQWASGSENFQYSTWQSLAALAGMKTGERKPYELVLSNGNKIPLEVFTELQGKPMSAIIQKEFDIYNGAVKERNVFHSFYSPEGLTLSEIAGKKEPAIMARKAGTVSDKQSKQYKQSGLGGAAPVAAATEPAESGASIF